MPAGNQALLSRSAPLARSRRSLCASRLFSAEEAPHPARHAAVTGLGSAFVVQEVVLMHGDARLAEKGAGVVYSGGRYAFGEGGVDEVVAVPPNAVDAQAEELFSS